MNHGRVEEVLRDVRATGSARVGFVSPVVSVILAAESRRGGVFGIDFEAPARTYADHVGLDSILKGVPPCVFGSSGEGMNYSPVVPLLQEEDVEFATGTVTTCLFHQLGAAYRGFAQEVSGVVGELHDNVLSHARGAGYSALQLYEGRRIEFAVADGGVGLLRNAKSTASVSTDQAAIEWALTKNNTSARPTPDLAQKVPSDMIHNPFRGRAIVSTTSNNHMGHGLWRLTELVKSFQGSLWVASGEASFLISPASPRGEYRRFPLGWKGLAIELELPVRLASLGNRRDDSVLAKRLGL